MNRRFRLLAALTVMVAFSAYFAEGVIAVFCTSVQGMETVVQAEAGHHGSGHGTDHGQDAPGSEAPSQGTSHESHCPLGMGGGASCVAVSLPGSAAAVQDVPAGYEMEHAASQAGVELLLIHTFYHPPRA